MPKQSSSKRDPETGSTQIEAPASPDCGLAPSEQADFCWKVIPRYDAYINGSNTKAAIVLTFNSFVLGTIVLKWAEISHVYGSSKIALGVAVVLLVLTGITSTVSLWLGLNAIVPILHSAKEPNKYHSLVFFGHVAEFGEPDGYVSAVRAATPLTVAEDLTKQAHALAKIAATKFGYLTWSVRCIIFVQLPAILMLILTAGAVAFVGVVNGGQG